MFVIRKVVWLVFAFTFLTLTLRAANVTRYRLHGHVPDVINHLTSSGLLPDTNQLQLAIGLPLHNQTALGDLMHQLYDPASTNFHKFLTPSDFTARFGPTVAEYQALQDFAHSNGLTVVHQHGNRLVLEVTGKAADVTRAFQVNLRKYHHPRENRDFFAPDTEPSVPAGLSVADVWGLSDYWEARPMSHAAAPQSARPLGGTFPLGNYAGSDLRNAYVPGTSLDGTGQSVALFQFSDYVKSSITNYEHVIGYTNLVDVTNIVVQQQTYGTPSTSENFETCLDIETAIAMAPKLSHVYVYEINQVLPSVILSQMANDNLAKQLSSSWTWSGGPTATVDAALLQMIMQGQSYFQASGDDDAYTGPQALDNVNQTTAPLDSTNLIAVGGTTLTTASAGGPWSFEQVWNYNPFGGSHLNEGSGGGVSTYYTLPAWQAGVNTNVSQGSASFRNVPDVAMLADGVGVVYTSGTRTIKSQTNGAAGTSCAAPMWAGFCALMNQQAAAGGSPPVGFINPAIYSLAQTANYANAFHDVTAGNNVGTNTPNQFNATNGYDLATGLGTPNGANLINALLPAPVFLVPPAGQTTTNGANVTLTAIVGGASPQAFQWLLNGTNLPAGGNASGVNTTSLTITSATTNNSGNYSLIYTNPSGAVTSAVAILTVGQPPVFLAQPTNLTQLAGSTAVFSATVAGSTPLGFQWQHANTNLINNASVSGATTTTLTLANISSTNAGNYTLVFTNLFGVATSSVASLTVVLPPVITASTLTNRTIQCGTNVAYSLTLSGTAPLAVQWSLDAIAISGATNTSLALTNIHLPSHTVSVTVSNAYAGTASNAILSVQDTLPPVITLNGASRLTNELGSSFIDPGATALDQCAGVVPVTTNGVVNGNIIGTNTLSYTANDGNGNTGAVTRIVVVRDSTPPTIAYSFTNLFLTLDTNCSALMPNVTGTNDFLATDLSGSPVVTQSPVTNAPLSAGTNLVVITATDTSGNASQSTNYLIVSDINPPIFLLQPQSQTNVGGATVTFTTAATACTTLAYQWLFNTNSLPSQTNNSLTLSNLATNQSGNYSVIATSSGGMITSAVAALTVTIQTNPTPVIAQVSLGASGLALTLGGAYNNIYILQSRTDLVAGQWQPLATNQFGPSGTWQFIDTQATNQAQNFYRLELGP